MAIAAVVEVTRLDDGWILAPERYDPRRRHTEHDGPRLADVVHVFREQIDATKAVASQRFLVLDTGDARGGIIRTTKASCNGPAIGSTKKRIFPGQVIISRLRPYLRQIAWVDRGLLGQEVSSLELLCSTEFFVLDSKDGASIAFLVPFLLSSDVQSVLAASQEGGHHPRFNEHTLKTLPIPVPVLERRAELSVQVEHAVDQARRAFGAIGDTIETVVQLAKTEPIV